MGIGSLFHSNFQANEGQGSWEAPGTVTGRGHKELAEPGQWREKNIDRRRDIAKMVTTGLGIKLIMCGKQAGLEVTHGVKAKSEGW